MRKEQTRERMRREQNKRENCVIRKENISNGMISSESEKDKGPRGR